MSAFPFPPSAFEFSLPSLTLGARRNEFSPPLTREARRIISDLVADFRDDFCATRENSNLEIDERKEEKTRSVVPPGVLIAETIKSPGAKFAV
jgi:hypothetical protein